MSKTAKALLALSLLLNVVTGVLALKNHLDQPVLLAEAKLEVKMLREQLGIEKKDHPGFNKTTSGSLVDYLYERWERDRNMLGRLDAIETITFPLSQAGGANKQLRQLATMARFQDSDGDGVPWMHDECYRLDQPSPNTDIDLDGCDDATTDVTYRAFEFYIAVDKDGHLLDDWPVPEKTSRDDHLAYQWRVGRTDGFVPRAENFTAGNYFVGYLQCIAFDPDGNPIPKDAKKFKFGSYGSCFVQ